jgi:putative membrane protein
MRAASDDDRQQRPKLGDMMYGEHMNAGGWILSAFVSALVVALIIFAIVWLIRSQSSDAPAPAKHQRESARELLDRRLARGEISEDEYRSLQATLRDGQPADPGRPAPA